MITWPPGKMEEEQKKGGEGERFPAPQVKTFCYFYKQCLLCRLRHISPKCTEDPFNDWGGGRGCNKFVSFGGGDGTKVAPTGDISDQPPGGID